MSNPALDEFNALMASSTASRSQQHPSDRPSRSSSADSTTLATSTKHLSIRSSSSRPPPPDPYDPAGDGQGSDDDNDHYHAIRPARTPSTYYLPHHYAPDANTGPKGVIADAQAFEREKRGGRSATYERTVLLDLPKRQRPSADGRRSRSRSAAKEERDDESDDDDDDDGVRAWRESRRRELQGQTRPGARGYEGLRVVDAMGYLDAIEEAGDAVVVVYIYGDDDDDDEGRSREYARALAGVAARRAQLTVVALRAREAEMEAAGVPALLAYRQGDKFAGVVPVRLGMGRGGAGGRVAEMEELLRGIDVL